MTFYNFAILQLVGNGLSLTERLQSWDISLAKIPAPSFRNLPDNLSMSAALDQFKLFKIFNIFSGDVSANSKFKSLNLSVVFNSYLFAWSNFTNNLH